MSDSSTWTTTPNVAARSTKTPGLGTGYHEIRGIPINNIAVTFPPDFTCAAQPVLNPQGQTLHKLCEEYFYLSQKKSNRHPVLSKVRLTDAFDISCTYINGIQLNAMSFELLVTTDDGYPRLVFEVGNLTQSEPYRSQNALKAAIAKSVGIPRWHKSFDGPFPSLEVVHKEADLGGVDTKCTEVTKRDLNAADIELWLIRQKWQFPAGWEFVTSYEAYLAKSKV